MVIYLVIIALIILIHLTKLQYNESQKNGSESIIHAIGVN